MPNVGKTDRRGIVHPRFTDREGRTWTIDLNFEVYRRVLGNCDVDLCDIVYEDQKCLVQLRDAVTLVDVLFEIVREQAAAKGVDEHAFAKAIDMEVLADALRKLIDEMLFFSRSHPRAAIVREAVSAADEAEKRMAKEVEKAIPTLRKKMQQALYAPGGLDGLLRESSASTPESGPSDNSPGLPTDGNGKPGTTPLTCWPSKPKRTATRRSESPRSSRKTSTRLRT